ncbi:MAG: geranylgeranyl reductase family protein [Pseudomonadota bacterium]
MLRVDVDVVVIGSGPGAGAALSQLSATSARVAVLEAAELPRPKACGGLTLCSALRDFQWLLSDVYQRRIVRRSYRFRGGDLHGEERQDTPLSLVDRAEFDAALVLNALCASHGSIRLYEGCRVVRVEEFEDSVEVTIEGGTVFRGDYLIAADGVASLTARCLSMPPRGVAGPSVEADIVVSSEAFAGFSESVFFDYFCLPQGYGWIFPKQDRTLNVGVVSWDRKAKVALHFAQFVDSYLNEADVISKHQIAFPIPAFRGEGAVATRRVCLVGDAASLVDPVSGEGIRYALISGALAGKTIAGVLDASFGGAVHRMGCLAYERDVRCQVEPQLLPILRFASLPFNEAPEHYYRRFVLGGRSKAYS